MLTCKKCNRNIKDNEEHMTLEMERSRRSGEVTFCKDCGNILDNAYNEIEKYKKIINEFWSICEKNWTSNRKKL